MASFQKFDDWFTAAMARRKSYLLSQALRTKVAVVREMMNGTRLPDARWYARMDRFLGVALGTTRKRATACAPPRSKPKSSFTSNL